jgi:hypothetical protein
MKVIPTLLHVTAASMLMCIGAGCAGDHTKDQVVATAADSASTPDPSPVCAQLKNSMSGAVTGIKNSASTTAADVARWQSNRNKGQGVSTPVNLEISKLAPQEPVTVCALTGRFPVPMPPGVDDGKEQIAIYIVTSSGQIIFDAAGEASRVQSQIGLGPNDPPTPTTAPR